MDLGLTADTQVECLGVSPLGDPVSYRIRGAVIAIRREYSRQIRVDGNENKNQFSVALSGNPNVGKSTLFNSLTGSSQHTATGPGLQFPVLKEAAPQKNTTMFSQTFRERILLWLTLLKKRLHGTASVLGTVMPLWLSVTLPVWNGT